MAPGGLPKLVLSFYTMIDASILGGIFFRMFSEFSSLASICKYGSCLVWFIPLKSIGYFTVTLNTLFINTFSNTYGII